MLLYPITTDVGLNHMATDWWLFENANFPSFRHYKWEIEETSFGYGQDWRWVEQVTALPIGKLIRRPTGGGIVKHGEDWTYCLSLPSRHKSFDISPLDLYRNIHECIGRALRIQEIETRLQPCPAIKGRVIPGDCFEEPVGWDLMDCQTNRKVAGAAMKRARKGVLVQGTIVIQRNWNLDPINFYKSLTCFCAEILEEREETTMWPKSFADQQKSIRNQFSKLSWKKERKRS